MLKEQDGLRRAGLKIWLFDHSGMLCCLNMRRIIFVGLCQARKLVNRLRFPDALLSQRLQVGGHLYNIFHRVPFFNTGIRTGSVELVLF